MRIKVGITIAAPPRRVWEVVEQIERHVDWMADAREIRFTSEQRRGVGTAFECLTAIGPFHLVDRMRVTEWEPEHMMGIEHRGIVSGSGWFVLRRTLRGRTRFTWVETLHFPWWMGGATGALVAKPVLRFVWRRNLRRLQHLVELS
ncbi:MAG TPA: SRPBCC family protein [Acidimicrobiia bacterium]|nr:SRPBCC family protein [Acidimicrobiia bacterium]